MKYLVLLLITISCASKPPCKGRTHNCNNGDGEACYKLGFAVFNTLGKKNPNNQLTKSKAAQWMEKGCNFGHQKSCLEFQKYKNFKAKQLDK